MASDFNIRDSNWDPLYFFHLIHRNLLFNMADSFDLMLSNPINQVPTYHSDNTNDTNSVIYLIFLRPNSLEIDNHTICPELHYFSDHGLLIVNVFTTKEFIQDKYHTIIKNSEEEKEFTSELIEAVRNINTLYILDKKFLELVV